MQGARPRAFAILFSRASWNETARSGVPARRDRIPHRPPDVPPSHAQALRLRRRRRRARVDNVEKRIRGDGALGPDPRPPHTRPRSRVTS